MTYFVIYESDDGTRIRPMSKEQLLKWIPPDGEAKKFFGAMPNDCDPNYWHGQYLIIKGEVVCPVPETTVVTWNIP